MRRWRPSSRVRSVWLATLAMVVASGPVLTAQGVSSGRVSGGELPAFARSDDAADTSLLAAAARPRVWRAFQFNFCGSITGRELCGADGRNGKYVRAARTKIVNFRPQVVMLNEMCSTQFWALRRQLGAAGWPMRGAFSPTYRAPTLSCPTKMHGDGLLSRRPLSNRTIDCLAGCSQSKRRIEHRVSMCLTTRLTIRTRVCVVHIGTQGQGQQIADMIKELNRRSKKMPVIIGGDFNVEPAYNELDRVYHGGGWGASGNFQEVDACAARKLESAHCNEPTRKNRKLDYIFLAHRWFKDDRADATASRFSDHDPLLARFRQCATKTC